MKHPKKIFIFTRCYWTYINFRKDLVNYISLHTDYNISIFLDLSNKPKNVFLKNKKKVKFFNFPFINKKKSLLQEFKNIISLILILKKNKPNIVHNFTARPVIFSSIASKFISNIYLINSITGLGTNFMIYNKLKEFFIKKLYKFSFKKYNYLIFQNKDDRKFFLDNLLTNKNTLNKIIFPSINSKHLNIRGNIFKKRNKIIFLMFCRLLFEKGIREYYDAAKYISINLKNKGVFYLIGDIDENNPSSISREELKKWKKSKYLKILPHEKNISQKIISSDVIVFPSYGEGLPSSLLEATYFGKPVITTDVNGCKETVKNKYNGFLIKPRSSKLLQNKMITFIKNKKLIKKFGINSKRLFNKKFKNNSFEEYLKIYRSLN